jgi:hypothetical protein
VDILVAALFLAAVVCALVEVFAKASRVKWGWLAVAFFAAAFAIPALDVVVSVS